MSSFLLLQIDVDVCYSGAAPPVAVKLEPESDVIGALDSAFEAGRISAPSTPAKMKSFSADSFAEEASDGGPAQRPNR